MASVNLFIHCTNAMQLKIHRQIESLITAEIGLLIAADGDEIDRPNHVHTEGGKDSVHGIHIRY